MVLRRRNLFLGLLGVAITARGATAQVRESNLRRPLTSVQEAGGPQSTLEDELRRMSAQAGVIFAGRVLAIHRTSGMNWVEVEFSVEEAIRGCTEGATYRLREWAGLWAGGIERYRVGQRLLMLLHEPGASGLSSPIGGQDGAIPITGAGAAPKPEDEFVGSGEQAVDLRWLQTHLLRSQANGGRLHAKPVTPIEPVYVGREREPLVTRKNRIPDAASSQRLMAGSELVESSMAMPVDPSTSTNSLSEGATLRGVLAMLGAWEAQQANAAR